MKRLRRLAAQLLFILVAVGLIASWQMASMLMAARQKSVGEPPEELGCETIELASESGTRLHGWHVRCATSRATVVMLHGLGGTRRQMLPRARLLKEAGYSSVMIDLSGHGESEAEQVTMGFLESEDARAAVAFARHEHPSESIIGLGVSLGGAALLLASPLELDGLVLESVYPDITAAVHNRVGESFGALAFIPAELLLLQLKPRLGIWRTELFPIDHIADFSCPVFVLGGGEDPYTVADETRALFARANEPKQLWIVEGVGHFDLHSSAFGEYEQRLLAFLETID